MKNFNKKESVFIISGFLFFLVLAVFIVYSMIFLSVKINDVLDIRPEKNRIMKINFEGLEKIGIIPVDGRK